MTDQSLISIAASHCTAARMPIPGAVESAYLWGLAQVNWVVNHLDAKTTLVSVAVLFGGNFFLKMFRKYLKSRVLSRKRKEKRDTCRLALRNLRERLAKQPISPEKRDFILTLSMSQLLQQLKEGKVLPTEALKAFQHKALEAHDLTNCLVEPITEAESEAKYLESNLSSLKDKPLYGLPISVKDCFGIKGYDSTVGCSEWIGKPYEKDAVSIQVLKEQGAIPFVKTNVPQTMISWETTNPIFGVTVNPFDHKRGVGGSSGGEAALLACGGSMLGFGSDIGGSIRLPANMTGICGFKPTANKVSTRGNSPIQKGQNAVLGCYGPMAKDVDSLATAMKALCVPLMSSLDPTVPHIPFKDDVYTDKQPLRIAYFTEDTYFHATPAMRRAVLEAKAALEEQGHELVPWHFEHLGRRAFSLWTKAIMGDQGKELLDLLKYDAKDSSMAFTCRLLSYPTAIKKLLSLFTTVFMPALNVPFKSLLQMRGGVSCWFDLIKDINEFYFEVVDDLKARKVDAIICPGFSCAACPIGAPQFASGAASYTQLYSVLNFPAGSLPVTKVSAQDEAALKDYPAYDLWHYTVKKGMKGSTGLPVNVQVAALTNQDEVCLRVMRDLEEALKPVE